jgi:hypothetical protein
MPTAIRAMVGRYLNVVLDWGMLLRCIDMYHRPSFPSL